MAFFEDLDSRQSYRSPTMRRSRKTRWSPRAGWDCDALALDRNPSLFVHSAAFSSPAFTSSAGLSFSVSSLSWPFAFEILH